MDLIEYTKNLMEVGYSREQAETLIKMADKFTEGKLVTKTDLLRSEMSMREFVKDIERSIRADIQAMEASIRLEIQRLDHKIDQLENKLTIKFGLMLFAAMSLQLGILKYFIL